MKQKRTFISTKSKNNNDAINEKTTSPSIKEKLLNVSENTIFLFWSYMFAFAAFGIGQLIGGASFSNIFKINTISGHIFVFASICVNITSVLYAILFDDNREYGLCFLYVNLILTSLVLVISPDGFGTFYSNISVLALIALYIFIFIRYRLL